MKALAHHTEQLACQTWSGCPDRTGCLPLSLTNTRDSQGQLTCPQNLVALETTRRPKPVGGEHAETYCKLAFESPAVGELL